MKKFGAMCVVSFALAVSGGYLHDAFGEAWSEVGTVNYLYAGLLVCAAFVALAENKK